MIIAGMSPTAERKKEVAFSKSYYTSEPVMLVRKDGNYANATTLDDFKGCKGHLSTRGLPLFSHLQLKGAKQETAMGDFAQMRQALESGVIDA